MRRRCSFYSDKLIKEAVVTEADVEALKASFRTRMDVEFEAGQAYKPNRADWLDGAWAGLKVADSFDEQRKGQSGVNIETLKPDRLQDFHGAGRLQGPQDHPALPGCAFGKPSRPARASTGPMPRRWLSARSASAATRSGLSGQDCERGTFSQRHSVLYDQETEARFIAARQFSIPIRRAMRSSTRCSRKRPCSASNMAIRWPVPMR